MISVTWMDSEAAYVATDNRYPSMSWIATDKDEAREELRLLIESVQNDVAWEVDVHDHWDDTPTILKAADEHGMQ